MSRPLYALLSLLFSYPEEQRMISATLEAAAVPRAARKPIAAFAAYWSAADVAQLRQTYVETFDFSKDVSLFLTYPMHGDSRERGMALARLKVLYRAAGLEPTDAELPDYLPLVLDFAAHAADEQGRYVLLELRAGIEVLHRGLTSRASPYASLSAALCAAAPRPTIGHVRVADRFAERGPEHELVGLEPFTAVPAAPNEVRR
jgi:nitrate reductase delta subunit